MGAAEDFAAKVANDVTEDIDCRETRKQLREVIRFWSLAHCRESGQRRLAEDRAKLLTIAVKMLLPHAKSKRAKNARAVARMALI